MPACAPAAIAPAALRESILRKSRESAATKEAFFVEEADRIAACSAAMASAFASGGKLFASRRQPARAARAAAAAARGAGARGARRGASGAGGAGLRARARGRRRGRRGAGAVERGGFGFRSTPESLRAEVEAALAARAPDAASVEFEGSIAPAKHEAPASLIQLRVPAAAAP